MLQPDDWQTIEAALNTARHEAEHEDIYGYPEKVAAIEATLARVRALAAQDATPAPPQGELPDDIREAIGHCWRWAQTLAEHEAQTDERYAYMCSQIDMVLAWLDKQPRPALDAGGE